MEFKVGSVYSFTLKLNYGNKPVYYKGKVLKDDEKEVTITDTKEKTITIMKDTIGIVSEDKDEVTEPKE